MNEVCKICGSNSWIKQYEGFIREGKVGNYSKDRHVVWKCNCCYSAYLKDININYESSEYRDLVNGDDLSCTYYNIHDCELNDKLRGFSFADVRDKTVIDIGCGCGSFLDLIKGLASKTIAVEPTKSYHAELTKKGHEVFSYVNKIRQEYIQKIDFAFLFTVLEHIDSPLEFLKDIYGILKKGGTLILSTPNYDNWLFDFIYEEYGKFFYRAVHKWYFNAESLRFLGKKAGFNVKIIPFHKYDVSNALFWLRDNKPTGLLKSDIFSNIDDVYRKEIERQGKSDFLYGVFTK